MRNRFRLTRLESRDTPSAFREPVVLSSSGGVLDITLRAHQSAQTVEVRQANPDLAGVPTRVDGFLTYAWEVRTGAASDGARAGDGYPGPTLKVNPGDTLRVRLVNDLYDLTLPGVTKTEAPTNLHTHGLHVSPKGYSDNVLLDIAPRSAETLTFEIPADHDQGIFWYHPHRHGDVEAQVYRGLTGLIQVGSATHGIEEVAGMPVRLMVHQTLRIDLAGATPKLVSYGGPADPGVQFTVNGQYLPDLQMQAPEEVWLQLAANPKDLVRTFLPPPGSAPADWDFDSPDNRPVYFIGQDGNAFPKTVEKPRTALAPGKRIEDVVSSPGAGGEGRFVATAISPADPTSTLTQQVVRVLPFAAAGDPTAWANKTLTSGTNTFEDLSKLPVAVRRQLEFSIDAGTGRVMFLIDGKEFPDTPLFQPRLGQVEEWTVINRDKETPHPIHIHMQDFQAQDKWSPHPYDQDTLYVDPQTVTILRIKFVDYLGAAVYHCHNLRHEDGGMMALINFVPAVPLTAVGADAGGGPRVRAFDPDGGVVHDFFAFEPGLTGGVRVALADVNRDGVADLIAAAGPGGGPRVTVRDGRTGAQLSGPLGNFFAFEPSFAGGLTVAGGDFNGDGYDDVVVAAGAGGGPRVKLYSGRDGAVLRDFFAYDAAFRGGASVAAGDLDLDGRPDLVTGAGAGGGPHVKVFSGLDFSVLTSFFAYDAGFRGGVWVAAARTAGTARVEVLTGAGAGGEPRVNVYTSDGDLGHGGHSEDGHGDDGTTSAEELTPGRLALKQRATFLAADASFRGGVRVGARHRGGHDDLLTGLGAGGEVGIYHMEGDHAGGGGREAVAAFAGFGGGVFVGNAGG